MIQIYPTLIDSYQYFLDSEMELQEMLDRINRVERPISEAALRGSALNDFMDHYITKVMEHRKIKIREVDHYEYTFKENKYCFPVDLCNDLYKHIVGSLIQIKVSKEIVTTSGIVQLYGYLDYVNQFKITDIKTTSRYQFPKYQKNFQHKAYLYCLQDSGINEFEYLVTDFNNIYVEKYDWNRYMLESLRSQLDGFLDFIDKHRDYITDEKILGI